MAVDISNGEKTINVSSKPWRSGDEEMDLANQTESKRANDSSAIQKKKSLNSRGIHTQSMTPLEYRKMVEIIYSMNPWLSHPDYGFHVNL